MKKNIFIVIVSAWNIFASFCQEPAKPHAVPNTPIGSVERLDPSVDKIIPAGAVPEVIAEGFTWTEGPLWLPQQQVLLFSDIPANAIYQWSEKDGLKLYLKPSGYTDTAKRGGETGSNGLLLDQSGRLVLCQHGDRRMAVMEAPLDNPKPAYRTLAGRWQGKRFNSPNDAVFGANGDLYFSDPAYGMEQGFDDPHREIPFAGVFKVDMNGDVTLLTDQLSAPNGLAFSPGGKMLYVANSGGKTGALWMVYEVNEDGLPGKGSIFCDPSGESQGRKGGPDGLKVRNDGIIFATGPGGVWILTPEGKHIGTILTGQQTSNCALDQEGKFLYMTADDFLMRIRLK